jgi:hypothetical protein
MDFAPPKRIGYGENTNTSAAVARFGREHGVTVLTKAFLSRLEKNLEPTSRLSLEELSAKASERGLAFAAGACSNLRQTGQGHHRSDSCTVQESSAVSRMV